MSLMGPKGGVIYGIRLSNAAINLMWVEATIGG